jgi:type III secretory pathway lipoprotein EscJ
MASLDDSKSREFRRRPAPWQTRAVDRSGGAWTRCRRAAEVDSPSVERAQTERPEQAWEAPSLVPTPAEERARYERSVAADLATTIETLPGVVEARVHLSMPVRDPLSPDDVPLGRPRASVVVQSNGAGMGATPDDVRSLVSGAVDRLDPGAVSVVVARRPSAPARAEPHGVPAAAMVAATILVAALALALLFAIAYARSLRARLRDAHERTP